MKGSRNESNRQSKQGHVNVPKPEIRDNLDSRKEKEANGNPTNPQRVVNANKPEKKSKKNER